MRSPYKPLLATLETRDTTRYKKAFAFIWADNLASNRFHRKLGWIELNKLTLERGVASVWRVSSGR